MLIHTSFRKATPEVYLCVPGRLGSLAKNYLGTLLHSQHRCGALSHARTMAIQSAATLLLPPVWGLASRLCTAGGFYGSLCSLASVPLLPARPTLPLAAGAFTG